MKFPAIAAALVLLECALALPTPPPLKPSGGASGGKTVGNEPQGRTGADSNKNVQKTSTTTAVTPAAVSSSAAKSATANPTGLLASSTAATKQSTETSLTASGRTATSAEKSSTPTATSSPNPTDAAKSTGTIPQSRTSDQSLPKNVNPTVATTETTKQTTTQSRTSDHLLPKSVNPTVPTTQRTKQTPTQTSTSDQPQAKSVNPTAATAQTTKPSVDSQVGSGKPKRAIEKPVELSHPPSTKIKAPLDRTVGHLPKSPPTGPVARTEPTNNSKKSLPRTNAAFRAASGATRRESTPTEKSIASLHKTPEPSGRTTPHLQAPTKTAGAAKDNRDGAGKVGDNTRPARAVLKPLLFAKPKPSLGAIAKVPSKTNPRPVLPEKDHSHATEGKVGDVKHKRPTRAVLPPSTQAPQASKEISTTQGTVKPSGKASAQPPTSVDGVSGKNDALPEPTVNIDKKAHTGFSDAICDMVKALIFSSELTEEVKRPDAKNSNFSGRPQSSDTLKTTPSTSTTQVPVHGTPLTTEKSSYQADSSAKEARIIPGLHLMEDTVYHSPTLSPVLGSATTMRQPAGEKSVTKSVTSSPTTHSPVGKSTEIPSTKIKIP